MHLQTGLRPLSASAARRLAGTRIHCQWTWFGESVPSPLSMISFSCRTGFKFQARLLIPARALFSRTRMVPGHSCRRCLGGNAWKCCGHASATVRRWRIQAACHISRCCTSSVVKKSLSDLDWERIKERIKNSLLTAKRKKPNRAVFEIWVEAEALQRDEEDW